MNTYQLYTVLECDFENRVFGVFASDQIPTYVPNGYGIIVNTDPISKMGQHWTAFYVDQTTLECFDSYGNSPEVYSSSIETFMTRYLNRKMNKKRLQGSKTAVCGQYCLFFLWCRIRKKLSMEQIIDRFTGDFALNDLFVYNFIKDKYSHCLSSNKRRSQKCVCKDKFELMSV